MADNHLKTDEMSEKEIAAVRRQLAKARSDLAALPLDLAALTGGDGTATIPSAPAPPPPLTITMPFNDREFSGSSAREFSQRLCEQVIESVVLPMTRNQAECDRRTAGALDAMREIAPRDGLEGMLAAQMVAAQSAGLEFLGRALSTGRPRRVGHYGRQSALLMALFVRQAELLQRLRGSERRSVRVEHERVDEKGRTSVSAEREQIK
ncbi:MAG: hypothetical protein ACREEE_02075 [Dongiaceae bacterium]